MAQTDVCVDTTTRLDGLANLAKSLNEESNQINEVLSTFEKRLGEMNLGVEAWVRPWSFILPGHFRHERQGRWSALGTYRTGINAEGEEWLCCDVLGYGLLPDSTDSKGSRYSLLIRTENYYKEKQEADPEPYWVFNDSNPPVPLLRASRELRLAALENLNYLVEALEDEARRLLSTIEKGRKAVQML